MPLRGKWKSAKVNWSEVTRRAIEDKVNEIETWQRVDVPRLQDAASQNNALRRKIRGWNSTAEIRRWRSEARTR